MQNLLISEQGSTKCNLIDKTITLCHDIEVLSRGNDNHLFAETIESLNHEEFHLAIHKVYPNDIFIMDVVEMVIREVLNLDEDSEHNLFIQFESDE